MLLKAVLMTCLKIHASLVKAISAVRLIWTQNPNRFLTSMTVAIARTIITDLSFQISKMASKMKEKCFFGFFLLLFSILKVG